ncbi:Segregation and condensation protein B [hydrothermal vent metagenome]|uniref:Segregation and condensation protein B n=1 Tax=hydrothermal vent metagenome TaxID=652676 RepID=A0A3B1AA74_9ZZZZ
MLLSPEKIKNIVEAALLAAGQALSIDRLLTLFLDEYQPSRDELHAALAALAEDCAGRGIELVEVGSGFRYQARQDYAQWVVRLWEEKPARYSRALLETLSLVAYRQPVTRGEIEDIRGVSVSSHIMKTLLEREWVKVVGHRDVPGKPAMFATTRQFLDYFGLKGLGDLPTLAEIRDIDSINAELDLLEPGSEHADAEGGTEKAPASQMSIDDVVAAEEAAVEAAEARAGSGSSETPIVGAGADETTPANHDEGAGLSVADTVSEHGTDEVKGEEDEPITAKAAESLHEPSSDTMDETTRKLSAETPP